MLMTSEPASSPPRLSWPTQQAILAAADRAARAIPPLWPLASSVAVNVFMGQAAEPLPVAAARLRRVAGARITMPRAWYGERMRAGEIIDADLAAALDAADEQLRPRTLALLKDAVRQEPPQPRAAPTVAELARKAGGVDWPGLIAERIGHWAAGYFDKGQALWAAPREESPYAAWRAFAMHDLTPEIAGLRGFAARVAGAPERAAQALACAVARLGLTEAALDTYFHRLLMDLGGWAQVARLRLWEAELAGEADDAVTEFLAIRLLWEEALLLQEGPLLQEDWRNTIAAHARPLSLTQDDVVDAILQDAAERAAQRRLQAELGSPAAATPPAPPTLQMAFCIDVRSEVFRRALESLDPGIQTLGFAGFFGLGLSHRRFGCDGAESRLPVLLKPSLFTCAGDPSLQGAARERAARVAARAKRAWGRFRLAAISSFAFVESAGPVYAGKLLRDALSLAKAEAPGGPAPRFEPALPLDTRLDMAARVLKAMSLTRDFAPVVVLAGHGAGVVNNPHASALQCGACGGHAGDVNARLLALLLNEADIRAGLAERGIPIPPDTLFVAALHDTTTDCVTLYDGDSPRHGHAKHLAQVKRWLAAAGSLARGERALRLPGGGRSGDIMRRARDWAEVRPEWGLAGCQAFVAAPRRRTTGRNFQGRVFLHDYDWRRDTDFSLLDLILTAPVVVASWISLQYYGSCVAPETFGAGNKLLHNVTGGIGVVEGNGGLLRPGLPWQSVHDGQRFVHEPLRLSVLIEAPRDAISAVLERHDEVRALFENGWLHLFALDDNGRMAWRYQAGLRWQALTKQDEPLPERNVTHA